MGKEGKAATVVHLEALIKNREALVKNQEVSVAPREVAAVASQEAVSVASQEVAAVGGQEVAVTAIPIGPTDQQEALTGAPISAANVNLNPHQIAVEGNQNSFLRGILLQDGLQVAEGATRYLVQGLTGVVMGTVL